MSEIESERMIRWKHLFFMVRMNPSTIAMLPASTPSRRRGAGRRKRAGGPYARTRHRLPEGGWLDTVVFQDGLGRAIQTRKTAEVHGRGVGWSVSGHVKFDAMGRVAVEGQAFFAPGPAFAFTDGTPLYPKKLAYDELGRTVFTVETIEKTAGHMDGKAETSIAYGFGNAGGSILRRAATVTDPEGKVRVVFRDPADRVVGVEEQDAGGHETVLGYDLLGRRTSIDNPDTGEIGFAYDAAGNLVERTDAKSQTTSYEYVFDQLRKIDYPDGTDVTYEYGPPGAPENGAARVVRVVDDAGSETRGYGRLGELVRTTRTVRAFRPGDTEKVFLTKLAFDVFGRVQWIVYRTAFDVHREAGRRV
jgi:YD repeat-containing protein